MDYFDLHCDTAYEMYQKKQDFYENNLAVSGEKGEIFDKWYQTFAVWLPENTENPFPFYKKVLSNLKAKLKGNVNPVFAVEGGHILESSINNLYRLKEDNIKFLTLTWNGENAIAGGVKSEKGLTAFGKDVIAEMNALNMAVDLSHLNEKSFYAAIEIAEKPLCTHSNCKSVLDVPRNLRDSQIKLLKEKQGLIGLNFYPAFLGDDFYNDIYKNIYHLCELGCENNIAIGSDFDGADMCDKMRDIGKIPDLYEALRLKGLGDSLLNKIFFKNAYHFYRNL